MPVVSDQERLVLIPAWNEEATVADVVIAARTLLGCDVLVIDDGSSDATAHVARSAGAMVVSHPFNLGVGAAIRTGMRVASDQGRRHVVQLDADGQHEPADAKRLLDMVEADEADLVVGSRFGAGVATYHVSRVRGSMMRLLSRIVSRRVGVVVDDTTSGFRAFGPRALELFRRSYPTQYLSDTVEALLLAGDAGLRIAVEPVTMHQRQGGAPSSGRLRSAVRLGRVWVVILLHPVRRPAAARAGSSRAS
jgi:glycosyltransferase involved in cell wall biosynthesis